MTEADCKTIRLSFAGAKVDCALRFTETEKYFRRFLCGAEESGAEPISVTKQAFRDWEKAGNTIDAFAEFCLLCQPVSEALMDSDHCVFHAFALRYKDQAFLIAGGSGSGKTTQGKYLLQNHPEEFSVINGDKPVLQYIDEKIIVHPSPWNGKEGLHGAEAAPLGGIFYLRRAEENMLRPAVERDAGIILFPMIFQSFENERIIRKAGVFTEKIVHSAPCFTFVSREVEESSALLYEAIKEVSEK